MRNPGRDKAVPLEVVAPGTDGVGYCGDAEKALIFRLEHPAQPALQTVLTVLEMHWQSALDQLWPALQQLLVTLQQVRQRFDQLVLQQFAETG
ncbi:hypothetical protein D3C75_1126780 [compost metagenome]